MGGIEEKGLLITTRHRDGGAGNDRVNYSDFDLSCSYFTIDKLVPIIGIGTDYIYL